MTKFLFFKSKNVNKTKKETHCVHIFKTYRYIFNEISFIEINIVQSLKKNEIESKWRNSSKTVYWYTFFFKYYRSRYKKLSRSKLRDKTIL